MKKFLLYLLSGLYIIAGINHFLHPDFYKKIMPPWLPWHYEIIFISGLAEVLFGILVIPKASRRYAAVGIIVLLIAIFPANIQMMLDYRQQGNPQLWIAILRLPIQILLVWWAWVFTKEEK